MPTDHDNYQLLDADGANGRIGSRAPSFGSDPARRRAEQNADLEDIPVETKYVVPFLWAAVLAGAILGYVWKARC
jgi:hypothetical protein